MPEESRKNLSLTTKSNNHMATKLKNLKKGDYFTLKPISEPREDQVYIKGDFVRVEKINKYSCTKFSDINSERFLKGDTEVYTDFIF